MVPCDDNDPTSFEFILSFFKALGNEHRLRMVGMLLERPHHVKELAEKLQLTESTACHHLASLVRTGLVEMTPKGNAHFYRVNEPRLQQLGKEIFAKGRTLARAKPDTKQWGERVLANYLEGESLKTIPASRKKRWEILKWRACKFRTASAIARRR